MKILFRKKFHFVICLLLRLESPTRSLYMEAPKGVKIEADAGDFQVTCRSDLRLESKDGEVTVLHSVLGVVVL